MVFCLPLSAKLLMYSLVADFRASAIAPAKDIFPCRVNDDFRRRQFRHRSGTDYRRCPPRGSMCRIQKSEAACTPRGATKTTPQPFAR